jgi:hypothetical protein
LGEVHPSVVKLIFPSYSWYVLINSSIFHRL